MRYGVLLMGLGCVALFGFGCASSQQGDVNVVTQAVEQLSGGKVSAEVGSQQMVFTDTKTGDLIAFGENVSLPKDFPSDIPVYANAKIAGVTISTKHDKGTSLTLKSDDAPEVVLRWYAAMFKQNGFREEPHVASGGTELRSYQKEDVKIMLTVAATGDKKTASLVTIIRTGK